MIWFRCKKNCPIVEDFLDSLRALGVCCHCRWDTIKCTRRVIKLWQFASIYSLCEYSCCTVCQWEWCESHKISYPSSFFFFKSTLICRLDNMLSWYSSSIMSIPGIELRPSGLTTVTLPSESSQLTFYGMGRWFEKDGESSCHFLFENHHCPGVHWMNTWRGVM